MREVTTRRLVQADHDKIRRFVEDLRARYSITGVSVAVRIGDDSMAIAVGASDAVTLEELTLGTCFEAGCLTKVLTSLLATMLAREGLVDMKAPISRYLPELSGKIGDTVQIQHLLSHSAGYQGEDLLDSDVVEGSTWNEFAGSFNYRRMLFAPGCVYDYSHSASVIVGKVIERVTGRRIRDLWSERILDRIGVRRTKSVQRK
jgi:CubicO group peptidase (beta-lactamase class C family)